MFRSPVAEPEHVVEEPKRTEPQDISPETGELPPSLRLEARKLPYAAEMLGVASIYDTFDVSVVCREIDRLLQSEMRAKSIEDTKDGYEELLRWYEKKANVPNDVLVYTKLEKILKLLQIHDKIRQVEREHDELLLSDPTTLSAAKLKKYIELKYDR